MFEPGNQQVGHSIAGLLAELCQGPRTVTRSGADGIKAGPGSAAPNQPSSLWICCCLFLFFSQLPDQSCDPVRTKLWRVLLGRRGVQELVAQTGTTPSRSGRVEGGVWRVEGEQPSPSD